MAIAMETCSTLADELEGCLPVEPPEGTAAAPGILELIRVGRELIAALRSGDLVQIAKAFIKLLSLLTGTAEPTGGGGVITFAPAQAAGVNLGGLKDLLLKILPLVLKLLG